MRCFTTALLLALTAPRISHGQAPLATDLWRVAAATLAVPEALADGPSASLWNPAAPHRSGGPRHSAGVETIHAPSEMGVSGVVASFSRRERSLGTFTLLYGRMGIEDLSRTETSPEALAGGVPVYSQLVALGLSSMLSSRLGAGAAVRSLSARLGERTESRAALDFGARLSLPRGVTVAAATRFLDPAFGSGRSSASYALALEWSGLRIAAWGTTAAIAVRLGTVSGAGERIRFAGIGVDASRLLQVDLGAAEERAFGQAVWRSRVAVAVASGRYRIQVGRDGGVNGFGGTFRFALSAVVP